VKLSYEWIKEYVDLNVSPEELADGLTMSGSEVESMSEEGNDMVMDLEITSNRPDCLSIIGLAREASAVFDEDLKMPDMGVGTETQAGDVKVGCTIKNPELCPYYTARIIKDINVKGIEGKIKDRISVLGMRPVNNVVDITNYCLIELGQPLHAFDLDKIKDGKVIIRSAKKRERITTIDGVERELQDGMLVIADAERAIAIAGIMGGIDTEVSASTKNILLESAYFDPISIRRTGRALGLSSDSSYRFERGVDKGLVKKASDRAANIIASEAGGKVCDFIESGKIETEKTVIEIDTERIDGLLGVSIGKERIKNILNRLGLSIKEESGNKFKVGVPSFREDLKRDVDLIEELARIYGYGNIPVTINRFVPGVKRKEKPREVEEKIRDTVAALGLNEIMTYSLISDDSVRKFEALSEKAVGLSNPLSEEQKFLTPQLLDGMLKTISWNINRTNKDLELFEIGKIYSHAKGERKYGEESALCIGLTGIMRKTWKEGDKQASLYDLKGIVEALANRLKISLVFQGTKIEGLTSPTEIKLTGEKQMAGFLGGVRTTLLSEYDITQPVFICQLKLGEITEKAVLENRYRSIPRFPFSTRDVSILCDQALPAGDIIKVINDTGEEIVCSVELADVYEGKNIPDGKKSLTYSIQYGLDTRTLTDEEIEAVHEKIKAVLAKKLNVSFR